MTTFLHTDGRVFTYCGDVEHTTRDKRNITLKVWETCCLHPGCTERLVVRTATHTPEDWPNFKPAKFCDAHRTAARKAAQAKLVKARADGLARWRASPEGKAAIEQRAQDTMGAIERAIYEAVNALALLDEQVQWPEVRRAVLNTLPPPADGQRDTRQQRVVRALYSLMDKRRLNHRNGVVTLLR